MEGFGIVIRAAQGSDADFLTDMLVAAAGWQQPITREAVLAAPELRHYIEGWPRPDDLGVVATISDGEPIGAAWLRVFTDADPGYGYIADDVPELSIGVRPDWRGRGVGRNLLRALLWKAAAVSVVRISLSVEPANPAIRLYRTEGFQTVFAGDSAETMVKQLSRNGSR